LFVVVVVVATADAAVGAFYSTRRESGAGDLIFVRGVIVSGELTGERHSKSDCAWVKADGRRSTVLEIDVDSVLLSLRLEELLMLL